MQVVATIEFFIHCYNNNSANSKENQSFRAPRGAHDLSRVERNLNLSMQKSYDRNKSWDFDFNPFFYDITSTPFKYIVFLFCQEDKIFMEFQLNYKTDQSK